MDSQERKQPTDKLERKEIYTNMNPGITILDQDHSEFNFSMALQDQERVNLNVFATIQEDDEEEEDDEDEGEDEEVSESLSYQLYENDYAYFEGQEFELEMELLEGQGSNSEGDDNMDEEEIDLDQLSYEELIALEEPIGEERRGLSMNQISKCLISCKYQSLESKLGIDKCVICQVEYKEAESLAILACQHPYHYECISKWLQIKKICPICSYKVSCSTICELA